MNNNAENDNKKDAKRYGCFAVGLMIIGAMVVLSGVLVIGFMTLVFFTVDSEIKARFEATDAKSDFKEEIMQPEPEVDDKIAVIEINGVITYGVNGKGNPALMIDKLRKAAEDDDVVGIILDINSGGGEITAVDEIFSHVLRISREKKPVVTVFRSLGASGAYFIAAGSDYIVASPLTITGSIGVIIPHYEYHELLKKIGLKSAPYQSGELKNLLSGGVKHDEELSRRIDMHIKKLVDAAFQRFAESIAEGRSEYADAKAVTEAEFGDGRILSGSQALEYNLVDQLGYFEDGVKKVKELASIDKAKVIRYQRPLSFREFFPMHIQEGETNLLNIDVGDFLGSGRSLYYLLPGLVDNSDTE